MRKLLIFQWGVGERCEVILPGIKEEEFCGTTRGHSEHQASGERHWGPWQLEGQAIVPLCVGWMVFLPCHLCHHFHVYSSLIFLSTMLGFFFFFLLYFVDYSKTHGFYSLIVFLVQNFWLNMIHHGLLEFLLNYMCYYVLTGLGQRACPEVRNREPNSNECGWVRAALFTRRLVMTSLYKRCMSVSTLDVFMMEIMKYPLLHVLSHQLKLGFNTCKTTRRGSVTEMFQVWKSEWMRG